MIRKVAQPPESGGGNNADTRKKFIAGIERLGGSELEWHKSSDFLATRVPPRFFWRFLDSSTGQRVGERLREIVSGIRTRERWSIEKAGRNWIMVPTAFLERSDARSLAQCDPQIASNALEDFGAIVEAITAES